MKIYMVKGYNDVDIFEPWQWNFGAFATVEAAQDFIDNIDEISAREHARIDELDKKKGECGLTEAEENELAVLYECWIEYTDGTHLWIEEYEVRK